MNKKLERYYDYIVNDILDNTIIDMDNRFYKFPFIKDNIKWNMDVMDLTVPFKNSSTNSNIFSHFFVYLDTMYGVKPQEMVTLWEMYVDRIPK